MIYMAIQHCWECDEARIFSFLKMRCFTILALVITSKILLFTSSMDFHYKYAQMVLKGKISITFLDFLRLHTRIIKLEAQGPCTGHRSIIAILYCFSFK